MDMPVIQKQDRSIKLEWEDGTRGEYHFIWLRDNCRCAKCLHPKTRERTLHTASIPRDIQPVSMEISGEGELVVQWPEAGGLHESRFEGEWLRRYASTEGGEDLIRKSARLWTAEQRREIPEFDFDEIARSDDALLLWCEAIRDYGLALVQNVPTVEGEVERFANRVAYVRETIYDRLHNVYSDPDAYNLASTTGELKPHTDMPNYASPPSIQLLHFMANEAEGGESTAVDGYQAAQQLKLEDPDAFELLSSISVSYRLASSKGDVINQAPMITVDRMGRLSTVRYSNQLMLPVRIQASLVEPFYDAYRKFTMILESPDNMISFKARKGTMIATHNHRVLHGRAAFDPSTGHRHLQLSYLDFDDVVSRIRMIRKSQAAAAPTLYDMILEEAV